MPGRIRITSGDEAGRVIEIDGELVLGRNQEGPGRIGDIEISRTHARVYEDADGGLAIEDLGSTNGTWVHGYRITAPQPLSPGDTLRLGTTTLEVEPAAPEPAPWAAAEAPAAEEAGAEEEPAPEAEPTPWAAAEAPAAEEAVTEEPAAEEEVAKEAPPEEPAAEEEAPPEEPAAEEPEPAPPEPVAEGPAPEGPPAGEPAATETVVGAPVPPPVAPPPEEVPAAPPPPVPGVVHPPPAPGTAAPAPAAPARRVPRPLVVVLVLVLALGGAGIAAVLIFTGDEEEKDEAPAGESQGPPALVRAASAAGCTSRDHPPEGRGHTTAPVRYRTNPPSSGNHHPSAAPDGAYERSPDVPRLVHSLEHGRIVMWHRPGDGEARQALFKVGNEDSGQMILTPNTTKMPYRVAATAWGHVLGCPELNDEVPDAVRQFRNAYRNKGPEFVP